MSRSKDEIDLEEQKAETLEEAPEMTREQAEATAWFSWEEIDRRKKAIYDAIKEDNDPEVAHSLEDDLYADFILWVSKNCEDSRIALMAEKIHETQSWDFPRWCA